MLIFIQPKDQGAKNNSWYMSENKHEGTCNTKDIWLTGQNSTPVKSDAAEIVRS